ERGGARARRDPRRLDSPVGRDRGSRRSLGGSRGRAGARPGARARLMPARVQRIPRARPGNPKATTAAPAGYSGTPLPRKLGIKPGSRVALIGAPEDFRATLGELPEAARLFDRTPASFDLALWFVRSKRELERGIDRMAARLVRGSMWICWPKKASGLGADLSENDVRDAGLAVGLVDYKICAVDATWSGLLFTRRKRPAV